ncbi:MAG: response regulator [Lachnospiraceae bacterium]|jgi:Response regulator of the LytR/AlgR family|nr:response regulator [Lachnospiraceae bacterium]
MMGTWRRICDDRQEDIRRIETAIRKSLNKTGQAVRLIISSFLNGGQLYDAACRENFDLLFLDIEMPCMDGFELAAKLCMDRPQSGD